MVQIWFHPTNILHTLKPLTKNVKNIMHLLSSLFRKSSEARASSSNERNHMLPQVVELWCQPGCWPLLYKHTDKRVDVVF